MYSAIQKFKESPKSLWFMEIVFWFLSLKYILYRYDLHSALKSILRDQYALHGSHKFERFCPKTFASVKSCRK